MLPLKHVSGVKEVSCFEVIADEVAFDLIGSSLLHWYKDLLVFKRTGSDSSRPHYLFISAVCFQSLEQLHGTR